MLNVPLVDVFLAEAIPVTLPMRLKVSAILVTFPIRLNVSAIPVELPMRLSAIPVTLPMRLNLSDLVATSMASDLGATSMASNLGATSMASDFGATSMALDLGATSMASHQTLVRTKRIRAKDLNLDPNHGVEPRQVDLIKSDQWPRTAHFLAEIPRQLQKQFPDRPFRFLPGSKKKFHG